MQINEVIQQVDLTKRAIKYYEEQGLLSVHKDKNGYRNYTKEYEKLKEQTRKNVKTKNSIFFNYHHAFIVQRRFMKCLQDSGYNDIFIPNMILLSPKYKEYHEALMKVNNSICNDLGLHYDSKYNLIMNV